jgi:hypothetical protein
MTPHLASEADEEARHVEELSTVPTPAGGVQAGLGTILGRNRWPASLMRTRPPITSGVKKRASAAGSHEEEMS